MPRLTITLSEEKHRALKEAAANRGVSVGTLVEESLDRIGVPPREDAWAILARARANAAKALPVMSEDELTEMVVQEVRDYRSEKMVKEMDACRHGNR